MVVREAIYKTVELDFTHFVVLLSNRAVEDLLCEKICKSLDTLQL
jgi:hypothetical protein